MIDGSRTCNGRDLPNRVIFLESADPACLREGLAFTVCCFSILEGYPGVFRAVWEDLEVI